MRVCYKSMILRGIFRSCIKKYKKNIKLTDFSLFFSVTALLQKKYGNVNICQEKIDRIILK